MSLRSLINVPDPNTGTTIVYTIQRKLITKSQSGGGVTTYTVAARGSLPTTCTGRRNGIGARRRFAYGEHDTAFDHVLYLLVNPKCDERDRLILSDVAGTDGDPNTNEVFFVQAQHNPDHLSKYWRLDLKRFTRGLQ